MTVELWTDGSGRHEGPGGWAYVLRALDADGFPIRETSASGWVLDTTSQRMEITAALSGFRALRDGAVVTLVSDSQYVCGAIDEWLVSWEAKDWRKVKNADLWREVLAILTQRRLTVSTRKVKGHSGVELNERCDALAGEARQAALAAEDDL